ncbi:DUF6115 domain-containing protein [Virgibacillus byunsanensis]|uniref:DUF6115 domain-containing protein n=1 Tax=Virgibacillus byunsanensis TaxID=570945 RepID=A0ABW3LHU1_9BACI
MISLLLFLSFLLHIVALLAILKLFQHIQTLKKTDPGDIMSLLETYVLEIKEENRVLQEELLSENSRHEKEKQPAKVPVQPQMTENTKTINDKPVETSILQEENVQDNYEMSVPAKVLQLHGQGLSIDEIAQKLNCGKTETELIIKIHANNK